MAVVKETSLYEVLYRFDAGKLAGAHQITLTTVRDDVTGEVYSVKEGLAEPVSIEEAAKLIGDQSSGLLDQIKTLTDDGTAMAEAAAANTETAAAAEAEITRLRNILAQIAGLAS